MYDHEGIFKKYRFIRHVVGCIDGTYVQIIAPTGAEEPAFVNRLHYHSINIQAVCDHNERFLSVTAKQPGSVHDCTMLWVIIFNKQINLTH